MNRDQIIIEPAELLTRLDDPNLRIYDATILFFSPDPAGGAYEAYLKGHIPGAAVFDHLQFSDPDGKYEYTLPSDDALAAQIGRIGIANDAEVIIYASSVLPSATRAWWLLRYAGHDNVRVLNGGLPAWQNAGGQLEQEPRHYPEANFTPHFRRDMFVTKEDVQAAQQDDGTCIEFALPLEMYGGAHIPGSYSLTCEYLMSDDMNDLHPDETILTHMSKQSGCERVITYCGGGIAATLNAVAYLIAGRENVAVYDGSLMEWMGEGLPLARTEEA